MLRRDVLRGFAGLAVAAPTVLQAQALFRTVFHISSNDPAVMNRALNMVLAQGRYHIAYKESAEIRVIATGGGLAMLRADRSPVADRVLYTERSLPMVGWFAADEDFKAAAAAEGAEPPLLPGVTLLPDGAGEPARLAAEGWSLVEP